MALPLKGSAAFLIVPLKGLSLDVWELFKIHTVAESVSKGSDPQEKLVQGDSEHFLSVGEG